METYNELDRIDESDSKLPEYIDVISEHLETFTENGVSAHSVQALAEGSPGQKEVNDYLSEMIDIGILEEEYQDTVKNPEIYSLTDNAVKHLDGENKILEDGRWATLEEDTIIFYGSEGREDDPYLSPEAAHNSFFKLQ